MISSRIYPIAFIGACLTERLPQTGHWGTVFAVFRRSCYLEAADGQVFCLANRRLGEGSLTLGVMFPADTTISSLGVSEGSHLETDGVKLRLGRELLLQTTGARIWEPAPVGEIASPAEIRRRLEALIILMTPLIPTEGLAPIVPHTAALAKGELPGTDPAVNSENSAAGVAVSRLRQLTKGLILADPELVDQAVAGLVGLGPGLTPSGDDLLGGIILALRAMPNSVSHPVVNILSRSINRHAAAKTTRISSAMLEQSTMGNGSASQHRLLRCLLGVDGRPDSFHSAVDLIRTGHTSGWDALAGILLGLQVGLRVKPTQAPATSGYGMPA